MTREAVLALAEHQRRRYWRLALGLGVPFALALVATLDGLSGDRLLVSAGVPFLAMVAIGALAFHFAGRMPAASPVLWIRRFGRGSQARRLHDHLDYGVIGTGNLITLGDDDVATESGIRFGATWQFALAMLAISMLLMVLYPGMPWTLGILLVVGLIVDRRFTHYRHRHRFLTREKLLRKLQRAVHRTRRHRAADSVFVCPGDEEVWLEAIDFLAGHVDVVVISAQEASQAVRQEIGRILGAGRVKPRNIVLLATDPSSRALVDAFPALADAWQVHLPPQLGWWPLNRTEKELGVVIKAAALSRGLDGDAAANAPDRFAAPR